MKKIDRVKEANGDLMIRVWQCDNFERASNDLPIYITEKIKREDLHNTKNVRIIILRDMLYSDE